MFLGIPDKPEIDRRKPPNNERVNERKPNTQRTTRRKEHGTQERNKEGTENDFQSYQLSRPVVKDFTPKETQSRCCPLDVEDRDSSVLR